MAVSSYDAIAEKVLVDLETAVKKDPRIKEFDVVPTSESENRNSSPILKGDQCLGLESWIVPHIYPFAHRQIMQRNNYKTQNLEKVMSCLTGVALLNPEMPTVWSRRRELILSRRLQPENELRLTRMALSRKPKSNEALAHRRWVITEILRNDRDKHALLEEELTVCEMIANHYHSNYHAWSHRMWSLQHFLPLLPQWNLKKLTNLWTESEVSKYDMWKLLFSNLSNHRYLSIISSEIFHIFAIEVENNLKWISSHVSDNSGFHFRKYLMNAMCNFLMCHVYYTSSFDCDNEQTFANHMGSFSFYETRKSNLIEFLNTMNKDPCYRKISEGYVMKLENNLCLFDVILSLIISELKSNHSLCVMFPGHEALWYYRRYLMHMVKQYLLKGVCDSEERVQSHQDKNGVPYKKDVKYDLKLKQDNWKTDISEMCFVIYTLLVRNEESVIAGIMKSSDETQKHLVRNYEEWLKFYLKINEQLL